MRKITSVNTHVKRVTRVGESLGEKSDAHDAHDAQPYLSWSSCSIG
jgi:hypothetical protein